MSVILIHLSTTDISEIRHLSVYWDVLLSENWNSVLTSQLTWGHPAYVTILNKWLFSHHDYLKLLSYDLSKFFFEELKKLSPPKLNFTEMSDFLSSNSQKVRHLSKHWDVLFHWYRFSIGGRSWSSNKIQDVGRVMFWMLFEIYLWVIFRTMSLSIVRPFNKPIYSTI